MGANDKVRFLAVVVALTLSSSSLASDPAPSWSAGWSANVWNTYCELRRTYSIPFRSDRNRRGFLSGTVYDQAFVQFTATTQTQKDVSPEGHLDKLLFGLLIYPDTQPVPEDQKILAADIGGYEVEVTAIVPAGIQAFTLDGDRAANLFQRFIDNQIVEFTIRLANGDERNFKIYPSGNRNFHVWAAMFQTCVSRNRN